MKTFGPAITALIAAALAGAQSLPPSPTASVGCEPHVSVDMLFHIIADSDQNMVTG